MPKINMKQPKQQQHQNMFVYFIRDVCVYVCEPSEMPHTESKNWPHQITNATRSKRTKRKNSQRDDDGQR